MSETQSEPMSQGPRSHWMVLHPRRAGYARLLATLATLGLMALLGMILRPVHEIVAYGLDGCVYNAKEVVPLSGDVAQAGSTFQINWQIENVGSCRVWIVGTALVRRSNAIPSEQEAYSIPETNWDQVQILRVPVQLRAPDQPGNYDATWQMQTANGQPFGLIMTRHVVIYAQGETPPTPPSNHTPLDDLFNLLNGLISLGLYALPAAIAIYFVLSRSADFLRDVYHLKRSPMSHLMGMVYGLIPSEHLQVRGSRIEVDPETAVLDMIGGPGWVTIGDRTAIVTERGAKFSRILWPGSHLLWSHERVRSAVDLKIQHRSIKQKTLTKDGIPLELDVDMSFRVTEQDIAGEAPPPPPPLPPIGFRARFYRWVGLGREVSPDLLEASKQHRFSREAVRRIVYETPIASPDVPPDWTQGFTLVRSGELAKEFAERRLDDLSSPEDPDIHPLQEIVEKALAEIRGGAAPIGIDVLNVEIGIVEPPADIKEDITEQRIGNWMIEWKRRAKILEAEGNAIALQAQEEARAEAQATMIQALTEGFRIATSGDTKVSSEVIAMRFIDAWEALLQSRTEKPLPEDQSEEEEQPDQTAKTMLIARSGRKE